MNFVPARIARRSREIALVFTGVAAGLFVGGYRLPAGIACGVALFGLAAYLIRLRPIRIYARQICQDVDCFRRAVAAPPNSTEKSMPVSQREGTAANGTSQASGRGFGQVSCALAELVASVESQSTPAPLADAHDRFTSGLRSQLEPLGGASESLDRRGADALSDSRLSTVESLVVQLWQEMEAAI